MKDSIIWFCFTAVVISINSVALNKKENNFKKIIIDNIKVIMILEFIVNTYTFPLVGELILVPITTFVVLVGDFASYEDKYSSVAKLMKELQSFIGIFILFYAISSAIIDYEKLGSLITLRNFIFPPLLTILFLPFI